MSYLRFSHDHVVKEIWFWQASRYLRDGWTINYAPRTAGNPFQWPVAWLMDIIPLAVIGRADFDRLGVR